MEPHVNRGVGGVVARIHVKHRILLFSVGPVDVVGPSQILVRSKDLDLAVRHISLE